MQDKTKCLLYINGKCSHFKYSNFFGGKSKCVFDKDERVSECRLYYPQTGLFNKPNPPLGRVVKEDCTSDLKWSRNESN